MTVKIMGALLIILGSGGVGLALSANDRRQEQAMRDLHQCLQWMAWELSYRRPSLAGLSRGAAQCCPGVVGQVLDRFAAELDQQLLPDPGICMNAALCAVKNIPKCAAFHLSQLGSTLGRFDLENQIRSLEAAEALCKQELEHMRSGMDVRIRNYRTLSLCAGTALVIILL